MVRKKIQPENTQANRAIFKPNYNTIFAPRGIFQADLMDMELVSHKKGNKNMEHGLVIMEIYSRYGWCYPLKDKTADTTTKAFMKWHTHVLKHGKQVTEIITDDGTEFKASTHKWMIANNIKHKVAGPYEKTTMGIIERWIRTLRMTMRELWSENNNFSWVPYIDDSERV